MATCNTGREAEKLYLVRKIHRSSSSLCFRASSASINLVLPANTVAGGIEQVGDSKTVLHGAMRFPGKFGGDLRILL